MEYLVYLGVAAGFWGTAAYMRDTLRGATKPNRVTYIIWAVNPLIAAFVSFAAGAGLAALPVFATGLGPFAIFLASFANKKSCWKLSAFDYFCGICSVAAIYVWLAASGSVLPISLAIVSDGFAVLPTLIKSWKYPETETGIAYVLGFFCALTSFAAIKTWDFSSCAFPVYLAVANVFLVLAVYRGKWYRFN